MKKNKGAWGPQICFLIGILIFAKWLEAHIKFRKPTTTPSGILETVEQKQEKD
jgi:hypothetical protein